MSSFRKPLIVSVTTFALLTGTVAVTGTVAAPVTAEAASSQADVQAAVNEILADTNASRAAHGLPALKLNPSLNAVSQKWSQSMADNGYMAHNPYYLEQIPSGWRGAAENVAYGFSVSSVTDAWMNSEGHRRNILGSYTDIGIGVYKDDSGTIWYTQNFGYYPTSTAPTTPPVVVTPTPQPTPPVVTPKPTPPVIVVPKPTPPVVVSPNPTPAPAVVSVSAPQNIKATFVPAQKIVKLSWTKPAKVTGVFTGYTVKALDGSGNVVKTYITTGTTQELSLPSGANYRIQVIAGVKSADGKTTKTATAETSVNVTAPVFSVAPTNVQVNKVTSDALNVSWSAPDRFNGKISKYRVVLTGKNTLKTVETKNLTAAFTKLTDGTDYTVKVFAIISDGRTTVTSPAAVVNTRTVISPASLVAVTAPNTVTVKPAKASAQVSFTAPQKVTGKITSYTVTVVGDKYSKTFTSTGRPVTATGLKAGKQYSVKVTVNAVSLNGKNKAQATSAVQTFTAK
jgi:uncharacterized protein YkwD